MEGCPAEGCPAEGSSGRVHRKWGAGFGVSETEQKQNEERDELEQEKSEEKQKQSKRKKRKERKKKQSKHHLFDFGQLISTSANFDFGQFHCVVWRV